jgi:hypothetical protein
MMKKRRPSGIKYNKENSDDGTPSHVSFSSVRISMWKQPSLGKATTVKQGAEEVPPWPLDSEQER